MDVPITATLSIESPSPTFAIFKTGIFEGHSVSKGPDSGDSSYELLQIDLSGNVSASELDQLAQFYFWATNGVPANEVESRIKSILWDDGIDLFRYAEENLIKAGKIAPPDAATLAARTNVTTVPNGSAWDSTASAFKMVGNAVVEGWQEAQDIYRQDKKELNELYRDIQLAPNEEKRKAALKRAQRELEGNSQVSIGGYVGTTLSNIQENLIDVVRFYDGSKLYQDIPSYSAPALAVAIASSWALGIPSTLLQGAGLMVGSLVEVPLLLASIAKDGTFRFNDIPQDQQTLLSTTLHIVGGLVFKPAFLILGEKDLLGAGAEFVHTIGWNPDEKGTWVSVADTGIFVGSMLTVPTGLGIRKFNRYRAIRAQQNLIEHTLVTSTREVPVTFKPSGGWVRPLTLRPTTKLAPEVLADLKVKVIEVTHPKRGTGTFRQVEGKPEWKLISKEAPLPNWGNLASTWRQKWTPVNVVIAGEDVSILLHLRGRGHLGYLTPVANTEPNLLAALAQGPREVITLKGYQFVKPKGESNFYWDGKKPRGVPAKSFGTNLRGAPADFLRTLGINPREFAENVRNLPRDVRRMWQNRHHTESSPPPPPPPVSSLNAAEQAAHDARNAELSRRAGRPISPTQPAAPSSPIVSVPAPQVFGRHVAKILGIEKSGPIKKREIVTKLETTVRQIPVDDAARTEPITMSEGDRTSYYDRYMSPRAGATIFVGKKTVQEAYYTALRDNGMYPDGYWAFGGSIGRSHGPLGRFYVSVRGTYAVQYLEAIQQLYSEAQANGYYMQFKMPLRLDEFARADAGVIYFQAPHQAWFLERVSKLVQGHGEWFADNSPLFTARILDTTSHPIKGLSFGMDPPLGGSSFGGLIAMVLNNTIARLKAQGTIARPKKDLIGIIRDEFEKVGIDPNKPAFMQLNGQPGQVTFDVMDKHTAFLDPIHP